MRNLNMECAGRHCTIIVVWLALLFLCSSCKKKEVVIPVTVADSALNITKVVSTDINECTLTCEIKPLIGENYKDVYLQWSTDTSFRENRDSILINTNLANAVIVNQKLQLLKQATQYYARISLFYKDMPFYSKRQQWKTDTLKIIRAFSVDTFPVQINRAFPYLLTTTFNAAAVNTTNRPTRLLLGSTECSITSDDGHSIIFTVPETVPFGRYKLRLERKGLSVETSDSIYVLKGLWKEIAAPGFLPPQPNGAPNSMMDFATCYSANKGYIIPGVLHNDPYTPFAKGNILQFDGITHQWSEIVPTNPKYFQKPICFYYNNSIYAIASRELSYTNYPLGILKKMWRFDLLSKTWIMMGDLPFPTLFSMAACEINGEWYIGLGADSANRNLCCGEPQASKKFWKYNPASNVWTRIADFPPDFAVYQDNPTVFGLNNELYAFCGAIPSNSYLNTASFSQQFWKYIPVTNSWSQIILPVTGLKPPTGEKYQIVAYNGKAYFLTGQVLTFFGLWYGFSLVNPCLEYDAATNSFQRISNAQTAGIMKLVFLKDNKLYFQSDVFGYIDDAPNKTNELTLE